MNFSAPAIKRQPWYLRRTENVFVKEWKRKSTTSGRSFLALLGKAGAEAQSER